MAPIFLDQPEDFEQEIQKDHEQHQVAIQKTLAVPTAYLLKHPHSPHLRSQDEYQKLYEKSIRAPNDFWSSMASSLLTWDTPFRKVQHGSFESGNNAWFLGGKLNACYNCVDRHAFADPNRLAIVYEKDTPEPEPLRITYGQLLDQICKLSWVLKDKGVGKGDVVTIYMPNIPEAVVAMLACVRIGAVHSVVFAGFSAPALRGRIEDARSKIVITVDESVRGGKVIPMKRIVDDALNDYDGDVQRIVLKKTGQEVPWLAEHGDHWWHEECAKWPAYIEPESLSSEDAMYMLYTSGSTGKPKGLIHTTAGYLLGCAITGKYVLDLHPSDVMFCAGDVGWITGNNYLVYAPLVNGVTTIIFDGTPAYPTYDRYWEIIRRNNATHFYTAPTALRLLKKAMPDGTDINMDRLRVIASIGEPLAASVWEWCHEKIGKRDVHVLDTYFQTETGTHVFSPLAGITPVKPGTVAKPFLGIETILIDPLTGKEILDSNHRGLLGFRHPWPSMARTVWENHERYMKTYFEECKGYYMTGDSAARDNDGYYQILGRVDDVVNVSGHRLSTAEVESALLDHGSFSEIAVIGVADETTGQALNVFVSLKQNSINEDPEWLKRSCKEHVQKTIGRFATPKRVLIVSDVPKTRSGKIMRRILRKIMEGERVNFGDLSTLLRTDVVDIVIGEVEAQTNP